MRRAYERAQKAKEEQRERVEAEKAAREAEAAARRKPGWTEDQEALAVLRDILREVAERLVLLADEIAPPCG